MSRSYILSSGEAGAARLAILSRALLPTTCAFLSRAGVGASMRCLDVGCGSGEVTRLIASLVGDGDVVGVDIDDLVVEIAARLAGSDDGSPRLQFVVGAAENLPDLGDFDLVYSRFLLSHLTDPLEALRSLVSRCRAGGTIAIEDVDFAGHVCAPSSWAFDRFVELYQVAARAIGVDPCIGPKLPDLLRSAGLVHIEESAVIPRFIAGEGKRVADLTFTQITPTLVALGVADETELNAISGELRALAADQTTTMSLARVVQVSGRVPSP